VVVDDAVDEPVLAGLFGLEEAVAFHVGAHARLALAGVRGYLLPPTVDGWRKRMSEALIAPMAAVGTGVVVIVVAIAVVLIVAVLAMSSRGRQKRKANRRAGDG
jgi:hypothetical protein